MLNIYNHNEPLDLELGGVIDGLTIGYHTYGTLNSAKDNVVWVCHALTANSDVKDWWQGTVENGKFLDPEKYFVVCANILGSEYGTTGAVSINQKTGKEYFLDFPEITIRDIVKCHQILAKHLGIGQLFALMGSSLGGFQAMEWSIIEPEISKNLLLIATAAVARPWVIALDESQRMAIECDRTWGEADYSAGAEGMKTARSIALLSYRGQPAYDATQSEHSDEFKTSGFRAASYQRYQGEKLSRRFSAYTYHKLTRILDSHNIGRGRGSVESALGLIKSNVGVIAVSSDILFPPSEHHYMMQHIHGATYHEIHSPFGHDGFLVEGEQLNRIIQSIYNKNIQR